MGERNRLDLIQDRLEVIQTHPKHGIRTCSLCVMRNVWGQFNVANVLRPVCMLFFFLAMLSRANTVILDTYKQRVTVPQLRKWKLFRATLLLLFWVIGLHLASKHRVCCLHEREWKMAISTISGWRRAAEGFCFQLCSREPLAGSSNHRTQLDFI